MALDLSSLERALTAMEQAIERSEDERLMAGLDEIARATIRAGVIQHFEITYELCWKFIQRWLRLNRPTSGADLTRTRKELFRVSAREGLVEDPLAWFGYGDARNTTAHIYNQDKAEIVYQAALRFTKDARFLLNRLTEKND